MFRLPQDIRTSLTIARKTLLKFQEIGRQLQLANAFLKIAESDRKAMESFLKAGESTRKAMGKIMAQFKPISFDPIHIKSFAVPQLSCKLLKIMR